MPLWCRFNKPTDKTDEEEFVQYVYAMRLWKLQDGLGLSFEMASMYLSHLRHSVPEHILRYRSDVDVDDPEHLKKAEADLWNEFLYQTDVDSIHMWLHKNCKRFHCTQPRLMDVSPNFDLEFDMYA